MTRKETRGRRFGAGLLLMLLCILAFSICTPAAAGKVAGLKQTDGAETSVELKWNAVSGADKYNIYLAGSKNGTYKKKKAIYDTQCEIEGLKAGKHYYIKVTAVDGKKESDLAAAAAVDVTTTPKQKVTDLKVTDLTDTSITLKWECSQADYYVISGKAELDDEPVSFQAIGTNKNKLTISKLTPRAEYELTVTPAMKGSYTAKAEEDYEASVSFHTLAATPAVPKTKNAKAGTDGPVKVTLKMPDGISGAVYELYDFSSEETAEIPVAKTEKAKFTFKITEAGRFYSVRYRYYNTVNGKRFYGKWSPKTYVSKAPANLILKRTSKKITASWKKVAGATNYTVYISTKKKSGFKKVATTKKRKYTIKKYGSAALNKKKKYYVKIVANKKVDDETFHSAAQLERK